ncbi:hypothetical protein ACIP2X_25625 [Streptomyces sp. NPDC089424]|uniref:hypothetical protein n=1 Tax=Streptomyces sp. NPDC089424 TaxID=3365917 RepID=UPI00382C7DE2
MAEGSPAFGAQRVVGDLGGEPGERGGSRRPWLWALGGVLVTSAVWSLAVFRLGVGVPEPDQRGYQLTEQTCRTVQLPMMGDAIAPMDSTSVTASALSQDPALDHVHCSIHLGPDEGAEGSGKGWFVDYAVNVDVALHKKSDPGVEFDAERRVTGLGVVAEEEVKAVPGIGDGAYLITSELSSTELRVRDGGAVFSLGLSAMVYSEGDAVGEAPETPEVSKYEAAMINDMRVFMADLKDGAADPRT